MRRTLLVMGVAALVFSSVPAAAQADLELVWPAETLRVRTFGTGALGDRLVGRGPLFDATGTTQVGTGYLGCVVMRRITDGPSGPGGLYRCSHLLELADGDLVIEGLDPHGPGTYTLAVLGGTGAYAGATGEAMLTDSETATALAIDLTT